MTWVLVLMLFGHPHQVFHESYPTEALCEADGEELKAYAFEFRQMVVEFKCMKAGEPLVWR